MKQGSRLVTTHLLTVYLLISLRKFPLKSPVWGYQFPAGVVEDTKGTKSTCTKFTIDITDWNNCMHTSRPFPTCPSLFQLSRQLVLACKWLSHRPIRLDRGHDSLLSSVKPISWNVLIYIDMLYQLSSIIIYISIDFP